MATSFLSASEDVGYRDDPGGFGRGPRRRSISVVHGGAEGAVDVDDGK